MDKNRWTAEGSVSWGQAAAARDTTRIRFLILRRMGVKMRLPNRHLRRSSSHRWRSAPSRASSGCDTSAAACRGTAAPGSRAASRFVICVANKGGTYGDGMKSFSALSHARQCLFLFVLFPASYRMQSNRTPARAVCVYQYSKQAIQVRC